MIELSILNHLTSKANNRFFFRSKRLIDRKQNLASVLTSSKASGFLMVLVGDRALGEYLNTQKKKLLDQMLQNSNLDKAQQVEYVVIV